MWYITYQNKVLKLTLFIEEINSERKQAGLEIFTQKSKNLSANGNLLHFF